MGMTVAPLIVGVGMTPFGRLTDSTLSDLACGAARAALLDAGIDESALEAVFASNSAAGLLTGQESIRGQVSLKPAGIGGVPIFNVENACASGSSALHLAAHYIASGGADCVLVIGYEKMVTGDKAAPYRAIDACSDLAELAALKAKLGPDAARRSIFMDFYAEKVLRYFQTSGATGRHLAAIAAKNHNNGALNPHAQFQSPQTVESVLASRSVVDPLTVLMCSPISDGGAALVLVSPQWAKAHRTTGPQVAATLFATDSFSTTGSQTAALAERAYAKAGIRPQDIHVAEVHDATAAGELFEYEDLGLAAPGEGWRLVDNGDVFLGGRCPVNPSGGLLARGHPLGATGVAQLCELTWQLRGTAGKRQVEGARVGVAQCAGGQSSFGKTSGAAAMSIIVVRA
jgi:acetyl-CoA acyltransferase